MAKAKQAPTKEVKKLGPSRKRRSALERKCISQSDKILFAGMGRAFFKMVVDATDRMRKLKKGGYKTKDADATTPVSA